MTLFHDLKELFFKIIKSRLLVVAVAFLLLFALLVDRLFVLQIVKGQDYRDNFELTIQKERTVSSIRGIIYDRNGEVLAYNELAYSVVIEDNGDYTDTETKNTEMNEIIYKLIGFIEGKGDSIVNNLSIVLDENGTFQFTVEGATLKRFLADIYGASSYDDLKKAQKNATAEEVFEYLKTDKFQISEDYSREEQLKIATIRFGISQNNFKKYVQTTVAKEVSNDTVAVIMENLDVLQGVSIEEQYVRKYNNSEYFSHIIGYTGKVSQDELEELNEGLEEEEQYDLNDIVGKSGIEQYMETTLQGEKGSEVVKVDNMGKVLEVVEETEAQAGDDVYLTIDAKLQEAVYHIIEQKLAGILVSKIKVLKNYSPSSESEAKNIQIPADDVYFALLNNNVVDISHFSEEDAQEAERRMYSCLTTKRDQVLNTIIAELTGSSATAYKDLSKEMKVYTSYVVTMLQNQGVLDSSAIDKENSVYKAWKEETISLKEYLDEAISQNWIDVSQLSIDGKYSDSEQIYQGIVDTIQTELYDDKTFHKKLYNYMIKSSTVTGKDVCMALYEQGVLEDADGSQYNALKSGKKGAYDFIIEKISNLEITPAQLALDPCSGSVVITNVNTGEVLALVTYPGYDNNRLANSIDADYYNELLNDLSLPLVNRATQQKTAPGSTFKAITAIAGLEEGKISTSELITDRVLFDKIDPSPSCWSKSGHGSINVSQAIRHSCNYFFYEVGYRLSLDSSGKFVDKLGIQKLTKYAEQFGLNDKTGIEIAESQPQIATEYPVTAAIGQSDNNYTNVGLARYMTTVANKGTCFNLSLIDKTTDSDGNLIQDYTPTVRNTLSIKDSTWNAVHLGMRMVVENTTAFNGLSVQVAGKTGTAQESKSRGNHALFVGFAPYENPEIAFSVQIAYGYTSANAAEIASDVVKYYYNIGEEDDVLKGVASAPTTYVAGD
jgi:penicillin-binding protein 2